MRSSKKPPLHGAAFNGGMCVTLERLTRYYKLRVRIRDCQEMIDTLRAKAAPGAQALTGMPHAPGVSDKVGDLAAELGDLETHRLRLEAKAEREKTVIEEWIDSIDDDRTRIICRLRFIRCMDWGEVADVMGRWYTADSVSSRCYRYLRQTGVIR